MLPKSYQNLVITSIFGIGTENVGPFILPTNQVCMHPYSFQSILCFVSFLPNSFTGNLRCMEETNSVYCVSYRLKLANDKIFGGHENVLKYIK